MLNDKEYLLLRKCRHEIALYADSMNTHDLVEEIDSVLEAHEELMNGVIERLEDTHGQFP